MICLQHLHIHPGLVIISLCKALADNLHQIGIAGVILRQQHQVVIAVLAAGEFLVKAGVRGHIHLAADDRINPRRLGLPVELQNPVHDSVVGDGGAVHAQFLHPPYILLDLVGTVQQGILRVDMQMRECHIVRSFAQFIKSPFHSTIKKSPVQAQNLVQGRYFSLWDIYLHRYFLSTSTLSSCSQGRFRSLRPKCP